MIKRAYKFAQILSLDIVIGVVVLLRFFCDQSVISIGWEVYALLGAAVWLIYTADHLRDAEISKNTSRERYMFHQKYRKALTFAFFTVFILAFPLIFFIPVVIFLGGLTLATFSLIYLLIQHRLSIFLSKELYVSIIYALGILMVPMLVGQTFEWKSIVLLILLAFVNLVIFSWYEKDEDVRDGFQSIATRMEYQILEGLIFTSLAIGLAISVLSFSLVNAYFFIGFITYSLVVLFPVFFKKNNRYRTVGDGVFLLPILFGWL
ncbi:MAG: hypothetical protein ABJG47_07600 [Ekhidna sp.]